MESYITTPLGVVYVELNEPGEKRYLDKLFMYHDRYIDESKEIKDVIGLVSNARYSYSGSELSRERILKDSSDSINIYNIDDYNISVDDYIYLSGFLDYFTFCKFNTKYININLAPDSEGNENNMTLEIENILKSMKEKVEDLKLDFVKLKFVKYVEEEKGV